MKLNINKKSFFVKIIFIFWVFYVVFSLGLYYFKAQNDLSNFTENRKTQLSILLKTMAPYLETRQFLEVKNILDLNHNAAMFDFAILKQDNKTIYSINGTESKLGPDERIEGDYPAQPGFYESADIALKTMEVIDYKLTLGINKITPSLYLYLIKKEGSLFGFVFFIVTVVLGVIVFFNLRDIINLTNILKQKNLEPINNIEFQSHEGEILIEATKAQWKMNQHLTELSQKLSHGVSPALLDLIYKSHQKKVMDLNRQRVLVSMDWNEHTKMVFREGLDSVDEIRSSLFEECDELILRYHGLRVESISDSLTFWMEDDKDIHLAKKRAIGCVRDIFKHIDHNAQRFLNLKFKCVLVVGNFEFKKTNFDYKLSSLAWYEANRTFKSVTSKNKNCLMILERDHHGLDELCVFSEARSVEFQGFPEKINIIDVLDFKESNFFYRTDYDLKTSIESICYRHKSLIEKGLTEVEILKEVYEPIEFLRSVKVNRLLDFKSLNDTHSFTAYYLYSLIYFKNAGSEKIFSAMISFGKNLLSLNSFSYDLHFELGLLQQQLPQFLFDLSVVDSLVEIISKNEMKMSIFLFYNYLLIIDERSRVKANIIDVLSNFITDHQLYSEYLNHPNNRVVGNALISLATEQLTDQHTKKIEEFYNHSLPQYVATAIYVDSYLYRKYYNDDPRYCRTNEYLKSIPLKLYSKTSSKESMIQNRALVSLQEIDRLLH